MLALPYEIWRDIKGYEGLYQVSNYGRVKSLERYVKYPNGNGRLIKSKLLKLNPNEDGYLQVCLCKDETEKHFLVHRLVAEAFIPNPENKPEIDHINRIRTDNRFCNLKWVFDNEQWENTSRIKSVIQLTKDLMFVAEYSSIREAERMTGISNQTISRCCKGKRPTAGGYVWRHK